MSDRVHSLTKEEWEILTAVRTEGLVSGLQGGVVFRWGTRPGMSLAQLGLVQFGTLSWVPKGPEERLRFVRLTERGKRCMRYQLSADDPHILDLQQRSMKEGSL